MNLLHLFGLIIFIVVWLFPFALQAQSLAVVGETEIGRRSTSEDPEGEDEEDDYDYRKYGLETDVKPSERIQLETIATLWSKDYKTLNEMDSATRVFGFNPSFLLYKREEHSFKVDFKANYRAKRYENQPRSEFNQLTLQPILIFEKKKTGSLSVLAGWKQYGYLNASDKDQTLFYQKTEVKRYFLDEKLYCKSAYRTDFNTYEKRGRDKTKHELSGAVSYSFFQPWVNRVNVSGSFGKRDAKDIEERDVDLDFSFWDYQIRTEHTFTPAITADLKYAAFKKDFQSDRFDSNGMAAGIGLDIILGNTAEYKTLLNLDGAYKKTDFSVKQTNNYRMTSAKTKYSYQKKKSWKGAIGYEANLYNFDSDQRNKTRHAFLMEINKQFRKTQITIGLTFKYKLTDYSEQPDNSQLSAALSVEYKL